MPDAEPPSIVAATSQPAQLFSPDDGDGKFAIDARIKKLIDAGGEETAATETDFAGKLFKGVKAGGKMQGNAQKSIGGYSLNKLPVILSPAQTNIVKSAAKGISYEPGLQTWDNMQKGTANVYELKDKFGFNILGDDLGNLETLRNNFFNGVYGTIPSNKKKIKQEDFKSWVTQFLGDITQFNKNYLDGATAANAYLKEQAISDLRKSGWKFIGYDKPA